MTHRESLFGKCDYVPTGSIDHLLPGTFYLTNVDKVHRRFYKIKEADSYDQSLEKSFNWTGALKSNKTSMTNKSNETIIMDDS